MAEDPKPQTAKSITLPPLPKTFDPKTLAIFVLSIVLSIVTTYLQTKPEPGSAPPTEGVASPLMPMATAEPTPTPAPTVLPAPPTPTVVPAPTPTPAPPIVPRPGPKPAPKPKITEQKIAGPTEPVPVGRLAKFTLPPTTSKSAGLWRVVARSTVVPDALVVESDGGLTAFVETALPCVYDVSVAGLLEDGTVFHWATTLTVGESPRPPPVPVPPAPTPPTPKPVVDGKRSVVIVRESADVNGDLARLLTDLRDGPSAKYFKDHGHTLDVYDDEAIGPNWSAIINGLSLPCIVVSDSTTNTVVLKDKLPGSADAVVELVKRAGG